MGYGAAIAVVLFFIMLFFIAYFLYSMYRDEKDANGDSDPRRYRQLCSSLPGATEAHPPELISWKVGGKMFACFGGEGDMQGVSVKTDSTDTAAMLIVAGAAHRAPYFHNPESGFGSKKPLLMRRTTA